MSHQNTRVAIVGGGMAGLELASQLGESDWLLLEAGEDVGLMPTTDKMWCRPQEFDPSWSPYRVATGGPHFSSHFGYRKRLGGRSLCWHGVSLPIPEYGELRRKYPDLSKAIASGSKFDEYLTAISPTNDTAKIELLPEFHSVPILLGKSNTGGRDDNVYTPLAKFGPNEPRIRTLSEVTKISKKVDQYLIEGRRHGRKFECTADTVAICSGAVKNAEYFLKLNRHIPSVPLRDHIVVGRSLIAPNSPRARENNGFFYCEVPSACLRIFLSITGTKRGLEIDSWTMASDLESFSAELFLKNDGLKLKFEAGTLDDRVDSVCEEFDRVFSRVLQCLGIENIDMPGWQHASDTLSALLNFRNESYPHRVALPFVSELGTSDHEHGTTPFGLISELAEDAHHPGIFYLGSSCFNSMNGANPSLSILAQARVVAEEISRRCKEH